MNDLSSSLRNYIKTIYEITADGEGARVSDIALKLDVTKASVSVAMRHLEEKKLIYRSGNRLVFLTEEGEKEAILALDKASVLSRFMTDILGVDRATAASDSSALEQVVSSETLCALCKYHRKISGSQSCNNPCHVVQPQK